ncbi:DNA cytosine methyltransferase (plasmid) [Burkholderia vietnamiensis]|nr:DNA cytosine methyltransferase [Burkholderia vietnamiensis]
MLLSQPGRRNHDASTNPRPSHRFRRSGRAIPATAARASDDGYAIAPYIIDAADHGVPQHRKRLFLVCTRSAAPITLDLPKRDHSPIGTSSIGTRQAGARSIEPDAARTRWPGSRRGVARSAIASWRRTTATAPA